MVFNGIFGLRRLIVGGKTICKAVEPLSILTECSPDAESKFSPGTAIELLSVILCVIFRGIPLSCSGSLLIVNAPASASNQPLATRHFLDTAGCEKILGGRG